FRGLGRLIYLPVCVFMVNVRPQGFPGDDRSPRRGVGDRHGVARVLGPSVPLVAQVPGWGDGLEHVPGSPDRGRGAAAWGRTHPGLASIDYVQLHVAEADPPMGAGRGDVLTTPGRTVCARWEHRDASITADRADQQVVRLQVGSDET